MMKLRDLFVLTLFIVAAGELRAQIPQEISESFGRSGWFEPKSSYSSPTTGYSEPGWYRPRGALARRAESRRLGWFAPLATTTGDSSSGVSRPGWYLPDRLLSDKPVSTGARSAASMTEGFTLSEARNESKARAEFARGQGEGLDIQVKEELDALPHKKRLSGFGRPTSAISTRPTTRHLGRSLRVDRSPRANERPSITESRFTASRNVR